MRLQLSNIGPTSIYLKYIRAQSKLEECAAAECHDLDLKLSPVVTISWCEGGCLAMLGRASHSTGWFWTVLLGVSVCVKWRSSALFSTEWAQDFRGRMVENTYSCLKLVYPVRTGYRHRHTLSHTHTHLSLPFSTVHTQPRTKTYTPTQTIDVCDLEFLSFFPTQADLLLRHSKMIMWSKKCALHALPPHWASHSLTGLA